MSGRALENCGKSTFEVDLNEVGRFYGGRGLATGWARQQAGELSQAEQATMASNPNGAPAKDDSPSGKRPTGSSIETPPGIGRETKH